MPPRRRPNAFEVTFPGEQQDDSASGTDGGNNRRRHRDDADHYDNDERTKRRKKNERPRPPKHYQPESNELVETEDLIVIGEDPGALDDGQKPTRNLDGFAFFDPTRDLVMVSLSYLNEQHDNDDSMLEGAGEVTSVPENDEDEGQEDDLEADEPQFIRINNIIGYSIDYTEDEDPMYIESNHARYRLGAPSKNYRREFRAFLLPHRVVQAIVSSAIREPERQYRDFLDRFLTIEIGSNRLSEQDLWDSVAELRYALEGLENAQQLRATNIIRHLLTEPAPLILRSIEPRPRLRVPPVAVITTKGSKDLAVLRPANQNATHVTPRIAKLATGWFKERLVVVGPPPPRDPGIPYGNLLLRVKEFVKRVSTRRDIRVRPEQRLRPRSRWLKYITIDGNDYAIGDTIVVAIGSDDRKVAPELPDPGDIPEYATLADYFWFGKIVYISDEYENVHVEWFEHSTKTAMEQLGHPQELFLTNICSTVEFTLIVGKVPVHPASSATFQNLADISASRFIYNSLDASYTEISQERLHGGQGELPHDRCPVCLMVEEREEALVPHKIHHGVAWKGTNYHTHDTIMIKAEDGSQCHIGQIVRFHFSQSDDEDSVLVRVKLFGRIVKLGRLRPSDELKDEVFQRHLFVTEDQKTFRISCVIGLCHVYVRAAVPELKAWLEMSPYHFYARYSFPSLYVTSWDDKRTLVPRDLLVCGYCAEENLTEWEQSREFLKKQKPLRALDPFSGVGAFGLGLEQSGCIEVTHAIEISPSATKTLKANSPRTVVYNQCSNLVLAASILSHTKGEATRLEKIESDITENPYIPAPPKPEDIDCIVAGFPCQPHSRLNMYVKAHDRKSNLILNVLSWVDFMQPKYCFFENVRGFLSFGLKVRQAGPYRVKGGIAMGGLKFLIRAMTDMNYQVRYGILQAGHYGTPQTRVRFFMVAAKHGYPLPQLPQPTHAFPPVDALGIDLPVGHHIRPIWTQTGYAPHQFVTIDDAISDLPRFDWVNPRPSTNTAIRRQERQRAQTIPLKKCKKDRPWCGYSGEDVVYEHDPATAFQKWCREEPSKDLQQYTRTYEAIKVERVVNIPMEAGADYRRLRPDLWEWHFANPSSSIARAGFKSGLYGRVDENGYFQATVTNVDPSAKQSHVLNPYCKRIFTVRELARSQGFPDKFVFYAEDDRVMTMHRQIGNAVPWPVSMAIGRELRKVLMNKWLKERKDAIVVD
ncbi:S-adenosyl-L-methionine-dependent methyltransferase [Suillus clintonianus]|uniref:S-adenosyl-L-methionine-dependent methyltransferase n=1 Tax=Suillus clintonianus TaxID=1904413 RepID=UPI001B885BC5|nr:S-adenosyl-L-methionine-dependent methyltransferase [Suillus clintonianus]KAG2155745.1 S-adenosyl-L-methionine-dependent methyltransferase [Suillus clintonianus]